MYVNYLIGDLPAVPLGGSTHVILSFLEPSTLEIPGDGDGAWIQYTVELLAGLSVQDREAALSTLRSSGAKVMASLGGAAASHTIYSKYDPVAFGVRAAKYIVELGLDGLDIDLEGWGNDVQGYSFLKAVTKGAFDYFKGLGGERYVISHAPEMPDFWHGTLYAALLADREAFDMIDFVSVQMYNQLQFPSADHVFVKDMYDPAVGAPTSLQSIAQSISDASGGAISVSELHAKMLLGFPCKDGSFPVGSDNLNQCDQAQSDLVHHGVHDLGYPLGGVMEWTQIDLTASDISAWNKQMHEAMGEGITNVV